VRLRSIPIKVNANMPRRAAIISGAIDEQRGSAHAYVVFEDEAAAKAALSLNMQLWEGAHLRVDRAGVGKVGNSVPIKDESGTFTGEGPYSAVYESTRSVFLGNLSTNIEVRLLIVFTVLVIHDLFNNL
jgi:exonuclease VII large subunit